MIRRLLPLFLAVLFPCTASAGDFNNQVYTSHLGYTITLPSGWTRVDAATEQAQRGKLPQNVDANTLSTFDVIFFPSDQSNEHFASTISILGLSTAPSDTTNEIAKAYADTILEAFSGENAKASNFKVVSSEAAPIAPGDALILKFSFTLGMRQVAVEQAVITHNNATFIVTCTRNTSDDKNEALCSDVYNSMKF